MNTLSCSTIRDLLPEYARGSLEPAEAGSVRGHVARCDECRSELAIVTLLVQPVTVPAGLEDRLVRAVRSRPVSRWGGMRYYAVAATLIMTVAAASLVLRKIDAQRPDPVDEQVAYPTRAWPDDGDPLLHGSPGLQALSEGELMKLLQELES